MTWHVGSLKTADRHDLEDTQAEIRGLSEISDEEYQRYVDDVALVRHQVDNWMLRVVGLNYAGYLRSVAEALETFEDPTLRNREEIADVATGLQVQLFNWLLSLRAYLDHTETWLKRTFGKKSPQVVAFAQETARHYDGHFAYRFLYKLRNYVQHCGLPPLDGAINEGEKGATRRSVTLHMKTRPLIDEFDGWGAVVGAELEALDETIDPHPLMDQVMKCVMDIASAVSQSFTNELEEAATRINTLHASVPQSEGDPYLFRIPDEIESEEGFERATLQMQPIMKVDLGNDSSQVH